MKKSREKSCRGRRQGVRGPRGVGAGPVLLGHCEQWGELGWGEERWAGPSHRCRG